MKKQFSRLLAGCLAWMCAGAALLAQNSQLQSGLASLTKTPAGLVALSSDGALLLSINSGVDFTTIRPADTALSAISSSGSTVVAVGDAAGFVRSANGGASYSSLSAAVSGTTVGDMLAISANGTQWVAVGRQNTAGQVIYSTDDGATWSLAVSLPAGVVGLNGVAWSGSRWVAVGETAAGGVILTSTDGDTWSQVTTTFEPLYCVASDGAGKVLVGGDNGSVMYADDGAATSSSFAEVGDGLVSEAIRAVVYLSGDNWVLGGDSAVRLSFNSATSTTVKISDPSEASGGAAITAFASTGSGAYYYYSEPVYTVTPTPHGPISLEIAESGGMLQLTLVGAESGNSYYLETSTTLASWSTVSESTLLYSGGAAPSWTRPLPAAGERVFYRVSNVAP